MIKHFFVKTLTLVVLTFHTFEAVHVDKDVVIALKSAIEYYNRSIVLTERAEMVEKHYDLDEGDEGVFYPIRIRQPPEKFLQISEELNRIESEMKQELDSHRIINLSGWAKEIKKVQEDLETWFGPEDQDFIVLGDDPMLIALKATRKLREHWTQLFEEFKEYTRSQKRFGANLKVFEKIGIRLHPENDERMFLLAHQDEMGQLISDLELTLSDEVAKEDWEDIKTTFPANVPDQTSQELLALENAINGYEIDAVTKQMLEGFLPDTNRRMAIIIKKLKSMESFVNKMEEAGSNYALYYMDKREELYKQLKSIKNTVNLYSTKDEL